MAGSKKLAKQHANSAGLSASSFRRFISSKLFVALLVLAAVAAAVWVAFSLQPRGNAVASPQPSEKFIAVQAFGERGNVLANATVAMGYLPQPVDFDSLNDGPQINELAVQRLDENGSSFFERNAIALAEEKNAEKGIALFQISYNDGTQDSVVTMKLSGTSRNANKIVFNLVPTPVP